MCGSGTHEKVYGKLDCSFTLDCLPKPHIHANSAWYVFSIVTFNLMLAI